jgi:ArsR family metal-binding transcriptional regulator
MPEEARGQKGYTMETDLLVTTFPVLTEFQRASTVLNTIGAACERIDPTPALSLVAVPALVMSREERAALESAAPDITFSGWVDYQIASSTMPDGPAPEETEQSGCFRRAAIMVLGPCVADYKKIRLIAHLEGDLGPLLPYLNAVLPQASYTPKAETLTFMDGYRMIALYPRRITIAKADEIVDAWMTLERIRGLVLQTWNDRSLIEPCFETRKRPPAIEIFKRLPGTNCGRCGLPSCLAFAMHVWIGETSQRLCLPVFEEGGNFSHLREPLLEICAGMGIAGADHG